LVTGFVVDPQYRVAANPTRAEFLQGRRGLRPVRDESDLGVQTITRDEPDEGREVTRICDLGIVVVEMADRRAGLGEELEEVELARHPARLAEPDQTTTLGQQLQRLRQRATADRLERDVVRPDGVLEGLHDVRRAQREQALGPLG
jgi:hypothetical protein